MRIRFYWVWLVLLGAFVVSTAHAQQAANGTITGRVVDKETQSPVAGATVEAVTGTGRTVASASTGADGEYRLANLPAGSYSVIITMVGFETERIADVRVIAGETSLAGASLTSSAFLLNPLIVSASKRVEKALDAPASVSVVAEREIAERPTTNPVEHLRSTPGVDVITTGVQSTNVVARGFNNIFSGALHALTDYRIAGVPSLRVNFLQFIPQTNDDLARMEVVLGPGAALYGPNTANGVLHMITKSPLDDQGSTFSIAGGRLPNAKPSSAITNPTDTTGGGLLHITGRTAHKLSDRFGFKISGQYFKADEFFYRDRGEDSIRALVQPILNDTVRLRASRLFPTTASDLQTRAARIGTRDFDTHRWSGDVRADWRPAEDLSMVFAGGLSNINAIELTGIGAGQVDDWKYSYVQARANYKDWFGQTYVNMSDAGGTFLLRNGAPITDQSKVWVSQLQHIARLGERQTFTYGADYISTMPETNRTINGTNEDDDEYTEFGAYIQSQTNVSRMLDVVLAGRYDKHSELPDAVWSPRAALVFKPTENHNFRATYNRAFSTPTSLNLFLDIDAGPLGALGPFGFRAHAQAPGRAGINLHNASGNLQIRTPFNPAGPSALQDISLSTIYQHQVTAISAAAQLPAQLTAAMRTFVADPTFATTQSLILLDPLTNKVSPFSNAAVSDIGGIEESTTSTFELGYKGILGDKVLLAADVWWTKHKNFTSPLITATPLVLLNPTALAQFMVPRLTAAFLTVPGTTPAQAQAQATAVAQTMVRLPGGVISSAETTTSAPTLILTYINFGEIDTNGVDLSATALLSSKWQWAVTGSLVSDDYFNLPLGADRNDSTVVALNAPKKKATSTLTYRDLQSGLNGELRVRYQDEFPANSAGFVGLECVTGDPNSGPCVKSFTLVDIAAGYRLPLTGASLQLSITNLFDEAYRSFIGTPPIRRLAILRLRYDL